VSRPRDCATPSVRIRDRGGRARITVAGVTPSEFAAVELALWEQALQEQRTAERHLEEARRKGLRERVAVLAPQVDALRIRAALALAEAVQAECEFRNGGPIGDEVTSTRLDLG
jgi:hypothetical protein